MSESWVTIGSQKLHSWVRSIGGNNVEDEVVVFGEQYLAGYTVVANNVSTATGTDHVLQLMAGSSLNVRVRSIWIDLSTSTAAGRLVLGVKRLTTAGTGGGVVTPNKLDTSDAAAGFTAMTLPTVKGTLSGDYFSMPVFQTNAANPQPSGQRYLWQPSNKQKPLFIPMGTANGICILVVSAVAGSIVNAGIEADESTF